jgi:hypothetical protein
MLLGNKQEPSKTYKQVYLKYNGIKKKKNLGGRTPN